MQSYNINGKMVALMTMTLLTAKHCAVEFVYGPLLHLGREQSVQQKTVAFDQSNEIFKAWHTIAFELSEWMQVICVCGLYSNRETYINIIVHTDSFLHLLSTEHE